MKESTDSMSSVLVTGAGGFLGKEVARRVHSKGIKTVLLNRHFDPATKDSLPSSISALDADVTRGETLVGRFEDVGEVIHAAGLAHVFDRSRAMDAALWRVNADGTENVAKAAAQAGVRHFLLISSASVYGPHEGIVDEGSPCRPVGAYAESKLEAENRAKQIALEHGMALTILRPVTMYGEGDPGNVLRLIRAVDRRRFVWIGHGANRKSLLHRDDVAEACVLALGRRPEGVEVFNVAGPAFEMREIISTISKELRRSIPPLHLPVGPLMTAAHLLGTASPAAGGGRNGLLDSLRKWTQDDVYGGSKIRRALGWQTRVEVRDGLRREVAWYLSVRRGERS